MPPASATASSSLHLVCGEDDYGVKQRARILFDEWSVQIGGMDHEIIDAQVNNGSEAQRALGRLREALQTLPFFGTGKVVWFRNCNFLADDRTSQARDVVEGLATLIEELKSFKWDKVRLLISAGKVDRRKSFYKTIEKIGSSEVFTALSLDDKDWAGKAEAVAAQALEARQKTISEEALAQLVTYVGPQLRQLHSEIEKLTLYVGDRPAITMADVQAIVTRNKQARAFALADAFGNRDLPRALACLDEEFWSLQFDKEKSEIGMLYGLIGKVRVMILLKELQREKWLKADTDTYARFKAQLDRLPPERMPEDRRFDPRALHPFVLFNALPQARKYTTEELVAAMEVLLDCNRKLVTSQLDDKLVLQQALVQIIRGKGAERAALNPTAR